MDHLMAEPDDDPDDARGSRARALAWAHRFAASFTLASVVIAVWALFRPQPYGMVMAILIALPLLAMVAVILRPSLFRIGLGSGYEANLATACAVPACLLLARTLFDLNLVRWLPLTAFAAAIAIVFFTVAARRETQLRRRGWRLSAAAVLTGAYAFGALGQANVLLDRSPQSVLRSRITAKHLGNSRISSYHLTLAPWGPITEPHDATVSRDVYEAAEIDDPACIRLHDGALGMAWFTAAVCR
jgi:membrane protein YdbS with pleckstrin-like domain